jgi:hypothetical protein
MSRSKLISLVIVLPTLVGCADGLLTPDTPAHATRAVFNHAPEAAPNVSEWWNVAGVVQLTVPPWVAQLVLGIEPEGPVTHIRCTFAGTMYLEQSGATFTGKQEREPNRCVTRGGREFEEPTGDVAVVDGRIRGRSVSFVLMSGPLACPQRGVISEIHDGEAHRMSGTARCIVPGHPKSDAAPPFDIDPPPAGTSKTLTWEAWR